MLHTHVLRHMHMHMSTHMHMLMRRYDPSTLEMQRCHTTAPFYPHLRIDNYSSLLSRIACTTSETVANCELLHFPPLGEAAGAVPRRSFLVSRVPIPPLVELTYRLPPPPSASHSASAMAAEPDESGDELGTFDLNHSDSDSDTDDEAFMSVEGEADARDDNDLGDGDGTAEEAGRAEGKETIPEPVDGSGAGGDGTDGSKDDEAEEKPQAEPGASGENVVREAQGVRLYHSQRTGSGYQGVTRIKQSNRWEARYRKTYIGSYSSPVDAAVAYARHARQAEEQVAASSSAGGSADEEEELLEEVDGIKLHLSSNNATGYKGVFAQHGRFQAALSSNGNRHSIGYFPTAVEAAVAYARYLDTAAREQVEESESDGEAEQNVYGLRNQVNETQQAGPGASGESLIREIQGVQILEEVDGIKLHLSSKSATGYKGVCEQDGRFRASVSSNGQQRHLGYFPTAVEAAIAHARFSDTHSGSAKVYEHHTTEAVSISAHPKRLSTEPCVAGTWRAHDRVKVLFFNVRGKAEWHCGTVLQVHTNGLCDVRFDDGDVAAHGGDRPPIRQEKLKPCEDVVGVGASSTNPCREAEGCILGKHHRGPCQITMEERGRKRARSSGCEASPPLKKAAAVGESSHTLSSTGLPLPSPPDVIDVDSMDAADEPGTMAKADAAQLSTAAETVEESAVQATKAKTLAAEGAQADSASDIAGASDAKRMDDAGRRGDDEDAADVQECSETTEVKTSLASSAVEIVGLRRTSGVKSVELFPHPDGVNTLVVVRGSKEACERCIALVDVAHARLLREELMEEGQKKRDRKIKEAQQKQHALEQRNTASERIKNKRYKEGKQLLDDAIRIFRELNDGVREVYALGLRVWACEQEIKSLLPVDRAADAHAAASPYDPSCRSTLLRLRDEMKSDFRKANVILGRLDESRRASLISHMKGVESQVLAASSRVDDFAGHRTREEQEVIDFLTGIKGHDPRRSLARNEQLLALVVKEGTKGLASETLIASLYQTWGLEIPIDSEALLRYLNMHPSDFAVVQRSATAFRVQAVTSFVAPRTRDALHTQAHKMEEERLTARTVQVEAPSAMQVEAAAPALAASLAVCAPAPTYTSPAETAATTPPAATDASAAQPVASILGRRDRDVASILGRRDGDEDRDEDSHTSATRLPATAGSSRDGRCEQAQTGATSGSEGSPARGCKATASRASRSDSDLSSLDCISTSLSQPTLTTVPMPSHLQAQTHPSPSSPARPILPPAPLPPSAATPNPFHKKSLHAELNALFPILKNERDLSIRNLAVHLSACHHHEEVHIPALRDAGGLENFLRLHGFHLKTDSEGEKLFALPKLATWCDACEQC